MEYVLDACAVLDYFSREMPTKHNYMVQFLKAHGPECYVHSMNMVEVFYLTLRRYDLAQAEEAVRVIQTFGVRIIDKVSNTMMMDTGYLHETYKLGTLDATALAAAREIKATLVSRDGTAFTALKLANIHPILIY